MIKFIASAFIILSSAVILHAQDKNFARKTIDTLSSEAFHGRGYVSNGDGLAAEFIADIFDSLGLEKINNSYFQEYRISVNALPGALKIAIDKKVLQPGIDYLVDPSSPSVRGKYDLHFLTEKELQNPNDFLATLKVKDDLFIVIPAMEAIPKGVTDLINFLKYEPSSPVAGIIQLTDKKLTWYGATFQSIKSHLIINSASMAKDAETITLNIRAELNENYKTQNVIGKINGKSDSAIVITAHYDHLGRMGAETFFPGANDNASGTALLLDLARHYSQKDSLPYTMVFIAFSAEELGLLGSLYFVENPLIHLKEIKFLLNFDLAGTGDDGIQVVNGSEFKKEFETLQQLNEEYNLLPQVKIRGAACNSDHCPFFKKEVPSFFIYTLGGITAYHDIEDKAETLPLTEYEDYFLLMTKFIEEFK